MKKSVVFCLMSFALAMIASAQGPLGVRPRPLSPRPTAVRTAAPAPAQPAAAEKPGEAPAFNWDATPVDIVLQAYGERTGKTILKDPQVPAATITLKSRPGQKLTDEEYLEAIETILEMNQIHLEPYGENFIRALPRKDVRKEGIPLYMDEESLEIDVKAGKVVDGKVISLMVTFKNIGTEEAQKALEGFKSNSGILLVFERTNSILVTDTKQNIDQMLRIAKAIDIATPVTEVVEYIQIKYANATEIKQVIDSIVQESMKEQEKNGKVPASAQPQPASPMTFNRPGVGVFRPRQPNQPNSPANNPTLAIGVSDADRGMIRGKVVTIADERSNKILLITSTTNMKFFKDVIAALDVETTPDVQVKVYRLKYAEAEDVSDMINDLIGNSVSSKGNSKNNQNQNSANGTSGSVTRPTTAPMTQRKPSNQRTGETKAGELNKDNVTVLADKRINGLVVMARTEDIPTIEQIIESMDIKLSQVLIETTIIEVRLGDNIETGMDWVQKGRQNVLAPGKDAIGQELRYVRRTTTYNDPVNGNSVTEILPDAIRPAGWSASGSLFDKDGSVIGSFVDEASELAYNVGSVNRKGLMNNWLGATSIGLGGGESGGASAFNVASGLATNLLGRSFSFVFDSDELGLSAILQASKNDSHSKYVAAPIIMTLDNKEASIDATSQRQFLTGWSARDGSLSGAGMPTPNYTSQDIGIKLKVTPKINPNGTVMLKVVENYTQVSESQSMLSPNGMGSYDVRQIDVPSKREMSADVLLENNQTVIFTGLTDTRVFEQEDGIPILKDIPFIGKWLFGHVKQEESRVELLVFMTPYVLDDAQAAQAEALRRKKTMSDPRPWDDHGWSLSALADPVSKKEQMRRIKEEWKKQDEERKTKIAIEKMKVERVKQLEKMSKEERDLWLKMHKKELDDEQQDELEEKMLDEKSQEELKKLAAQIKAKKLGVAEKAIAQAAAEAAAENERGKLDAEKKAQEETTKGEDAK